MLAVKYEELLEAFDFVNFDELSQHEAVISRATGAIHWLGETIDEEAPDDIDEPDRYISVPNRIDLDLGRSLALRFAAEVLPKHYDRIAGFFGRRGAYGRFKDLLAEQGCLEKWYAFESKCTETALRQWCAENDIQVTNTRGDAAVMTNATRSVGK